MEDVKINYKGKIERINSKKGGRMNGNNLICIIEREKGEREELRCNLYGILSDIHVKEGDIVNEGDIICTVILCNHPALHGDMCIKCGGIITNTINHNIPVNFRGCPTNVTVKEGTAQNVAEQMVLSLIDRRKLVLVLDLDQTLLEATEDIRSKEVEMDERYKNNIISFPMDRGPLRIKFRPDLKQFLQEADKLFELYVYTHGTRKYAENILLKLDVGKKLFNDRIMSRTQDLITSHIHIKKEPEPKDLSRLFPYYSNMVIVLDDKISVWPHDENNVLQVYPYSFWGDIFKKKGEEISLEIPKSENETQLMDILNVLRNIHNTFYNQVESMMEEYTTKNDLIYNIMNDKGPNVASIASNIRKKLLKGVEIVFSGVFPLETKQIEKEPLWMKASLCGATCSKAITLKTTHLIAAMKGTDKVKQASLMSHIYIVNPQYIDYCYFSWKRPLESDFIVSGLEHLTNKRKLIEEENEIKNKKAKIVTEEFFNEDDKALLDAANYITSEESDEEFGQELFRKLNK